MGFKSMGVGRTCYDVGSETDASPRTILGMHYFRGLRRINVKAIGCMVGVLGFLAGTPSLGGAQQAQRASQAAQSDQVEEIYIARSVRESRVMPTEFCVQARTGFKSTIEDQYTFQSIAVGTDDGRITNENVKTIGSGHGCFGPIAETTPAPASQSGTGASSASPLINSANVNFYLELILGKTTLKGIGDCRRTKSDFPERGLTVYRCFLDLSDPLGRYIGGQLTTNTMGALKLLGVDSDPTGYSQPSIATIRLWKKRTGR